MGRPGRYANTWVRRWVVWGGILDGRCRRWAVGMGAGRYAGRAVRGSGRRYAPGVARSFNFAFGRYGPAYRPRGTTTTTTILYA